jgi:hypothetical protein
VECLLVVNSELPKVMLLTFGEIRLKTGKTLTALISGLLFVLIE